MSDSSWLGAGTFAVVIAALGLPGAAHADAEFVPWSVEIALPACDPLPFDGPALFELLRMELETDGVADVLERSEAGDAVGARIRIVSACEQDASEVDVFVDEMATGRSRRRELSLGTMPFESRSRFLALAAAELLRATWASLEASRSAPSADRAQVEASESSSPESSPASDRMEALPTHKSVLLGLAASMRTFLDVPTPMLGARLTLQIYPGPDIPLVVAAGTEFHYVARSDALGDVEIGAVGLSAGLGWIFDFGPVDVDAGPRATLHWAWTAGRASEEGIDSSSGASPVLHAGIGVRANVEIHTDWALVFDSEVAWVFAGLGARVGEELVLAMNGAVLSLSVGVAFAR